MKDQYKIDIGIMSILPSFLMIVSTIWMIYKNITIMPQHYGLIGFYCAVIILSILVVVFKKNIMVQILAHLYFIMAMVIMLSSELNHYSIVFFSMGILMLIDTKYFEDHFVFKFCSVTPYPVLGFIFSFSSISGMVEYFIFTVFTFTFIAIREYYNRKERKEEVAEIRYKKNRELFKAYSVATSEKIDNMKRIASVGSKGG